MISNTTTNLKELFDNEDFEGIIKILQDARLETVNTPNVISKTINILDKKKAYEKIIQIASIIIKYKIPVMDFEVKEALRILINAKKISEVLDLIIKIFSCKKAIDEYFVIQAITASFALEDCQLSEKCYAMISDYFEINKNMSHTFWQTSIEGFLKLNQLQYARSLLKMYPIKYSYSEALWKNAIISNMNDTEIEAVFHLFEEKYENRTSNDDYRAFENIFNIFIEELGNHYNKIDQNISEMIYDSVLQRKIIIKEAPLEKFLAKVVEKNHDNFDKVQGYIMKADCFLTQKVMERVIEELYKANDFFSIFSFLKLSKRKKIPIPYDTLNLPAKILKDLLKFLMDKSEISFDEDFCSRLSEENRYYVIKSTKTEKEDKQENINMNVNANMNIVNSTFEEIPIIEENKKNETLSSLPEMVNSVVCIQMEDVKNSKTEEVQQNASTGKKEESSGFDISNEYVIY